MHENIKTVENEIKKIVNVLIIIHMYTGICIHTLHTYIYYIDSYKTYVYVYMTNAY